MQLHFSIYIFVIISQASFVSSVILTTFLLFSDPFGFGEVSYFSFHWHVEKVATYFFLFFFVLTAFIIFTLRDTHVRACVCVCVSVTNRKIAEFKWPIVTEFEANPTSPLSASCNWKFKHRAPAELWTKNLRTQQKYCSRIAGADEQADRQKKAKNATPTSQKSVYLLQTLTEHYESDFT